MGRKYGEWSHRTLNWDSDTDSIIYFDRIRTEYHGILVSNSTACDKLKTWKRSDFHKRVYWLVYWEPYFMAYEIYNSSFDLGRISFSKQTGFWSLQNVTFVRSRLPCYTFFLTNTIDPSRWGRISAYHWQPGVRVWSFNFQRRIAILQKPPGIRAKNSLEVCASRRVLRFKSIMFVHPNCPKNQKKQYWNHVQLKSPCFVFMSGFLITHPMQIMLCLTILTYT